MTAPPLPSIDPKQPRFGRLYAADPRDRSYPMELALRAMTRADLKRRTQAPGKAKTLDQGATSRCTMFGLAHCLGASPVRYRDRPLAHLQVPLDGASDCYAWSQQNDEWPGAEPTYYGTSVRAALDYARARGLIEMYLWARSIDEAKDYISRVGSAPIAAGFDWFADMSHPYFLKGRWIAEPTGALEGGHAFCVLWYSKVLKMWKCQNSWGRWADDGVFYIPDAAFAYLAFQANGELASFTEAAA
jgi:hypothetical protein